MAEATFDIEEAREVNLWNIAAAWWKVTEAKDASKEVQATRRDIKAAQKVPNLSDAFKEELATRLSEVEESLGIDTSAGDDAATQLAMLASIRMGDAFLLPEEQREEIRASLDAWAEVKPGKSGKRGTERVTPDSSYAPGLIGFYQGDAAEPYAKERPTFGSLGHTLHKGIRVSMGLDPDSEEYLPVLEGFDQIRALWGTRAERGDAFELGASITLRHAESDSEWKVRVLDTQDAGSRVRGKGLSSITRHPNYLDPEESSDSEESDAA